MGDVHGAARWLPEIFFQWIPELSEVEWPTEAKSSCNACPLIRDPRERFNPETRCCTYHPTLANFLVGRGLLRGGTSRDVLVRRITEGSGIDAMGISPPKGWAERYFHPRVDFGRDRSLRCPFWVGGELSCGIWADRNATCRTWFCKHDDGVSGQRLWTALREVLQATEAHLARECTRIGVAPRRASASEYVAWFEDCARMVESMTSEPPFPIGEGRRKIAGALEALAGEMPEMLVPSVQDAEATSEGFQLKGYSRYDRFLAPANIMMFLARLDGETPWRTALGDGVGEEEVRALWRAGLLAGR
jgi:hypothetical protein